MSPTEAELLFARLTRIKLLIGKLEKASGDGDAHRDLFVKLKAEIDAARLAMRNIDKL
jgi:hypothetical protein